jgi:Transglycosylase SLT domain
MNYNDPQLATLARKYEQQYGLPTGVLDAIRLAGERSNNDQVSRRSAKGVYQFMPETWKSFARPGESVTDVEASTRAAASYMQYALNKYDNIGAAFAEYNGGPKAARKYLSTGDPGNTETRNYVKRTLDFYNAQSVPTSSPPTVFDDVIRGEMPYIGDETSIDEEPMYEAAPVESDNMAGPDPFAQYGVEEFSYFGEDSYFAPSTTVADSDPLEVFVRDTVEGIFSNDAGQ